MGAGLEGGLGVSKDADGEVLHVGGPLCGQLEELHIARLHTIGEDPKHVLLLLGGADETADPLEVLALQFHILALGFHFCFFFFVLFVLEGIKMAL